MEIDSNIDASEPLETVEPETTDIPSVPETSEDAPVEISADDKAAESEDKETIPESPELFGETKPHEEELSDLPTTEEIKAPSESAEGAEDDKKEEDKSDASPIAIPTAGDPAASSSSATPPVSVEGGDKPSDVPPLVITPGATPPPAVPVGEDHVAQGVDAQTIGAALASAATKGQTLDAYLKEHGISTGAAPGLTEYVADKHGHCSQKTKHEWSVVIKEFYSDESKEQD